MKVLKTGGLLFVQTYQTFPLHAYPFDYVRFSQEALSGLFGRKMEFCVRTCYQFPGRVYSARDINAFNFHGYFKRTVFGNKVAPLLSNTSTNSREVRPGLWAASLEMLIF